MKKKQTSGGSVFPRRQPSWRKLIAKASADAPPMPRRVVRQKHDRGGAVPEPRSMRPSLPRRFPVTGSTGQTLVFETREAALAFIARAIDTAIAREFADNDIVL